MLQYKLALFIVETLTHFVLARPQLVGGMGLCEEEFLFKIIIFIRTVICFT